MLVTTILSFPHNVFYHINPCSAQYFSQPTDRFLSFVGLDLHALRNHSSYFSGHKLAKLSGYSNSKPFKILSLVPHSNYMYYIFVPKLIHVARIEALPFSYYYSHYEFSCLTKFYDVIGQSTAHVVYKCSYAKILKHG